MANSKSSSAWHRVFGKTSPRCYTVQRLQAGGTRRCCLRLLPQRAREDGGSPCRSKIPRLASHRTVKTQVWTSVGYCPPTPAISVWWMNSLIPARHKRVTRNDSRCPRIIGRWALMSAIPLNVCMNFELEQRCALAGSRDADGPVDCSLMACSTKPKPFSSESGA